MKSTKSEPSVEEALKWWESLPNEMKAKFPEPETNEDILNYCADPAANMCLEPGSL